LLAYYHYSTMLTTNTNRNHSRARNNNNRSNSPWLAAVHDVQAGKPALPLVLLATQVMDDYGNSEEGLSVVRKWMARGMEAACHAGNPAAVKDLLAFAKAEHDFMHVKEEEWWDRDAYLRLAVRLEEPEVVAALLDDRDYFTDQYGKTFLHVLAATWSEGLDPEAKARLEQLVDATMASPAELNMGPISVANRRTAVHIAAFTGFAHFIKAYFAREQHYEAHDFEGPDDPRTCANGCASPLALALRNNHMAAATALREAGFTGGFRF
jgi:hypothetical protein